MNITTPILCLLLPWLPLQESPRGDAPAASTVLRFHPFGALTAPRTDSPCLPVGLSTVGLTSDRASDLPRTGAPLFAPDEAIELIRDWTGSESWDIPGPSLQSSGGRLIVVQTPELHDRVRSVIGSLERSMTRRVSVRVFALPAGHPVVLSRIEAGAGPVLDARAVEEAVAGLAGTPEFQVGGLVGSRLELGAVRETPAVVGWDAEVAEGASQAEPVVKKLRDGCSLSACVRVAGEGRLHVAVAWNRATRQPREAADLAAEGLGQVDLPEFLVTRGGASAAVPAGGGLLVGAAQADAGVGPSAFLVLPALEDAATEQPAGHLLEDLRVATRPIEDFPFAWPGLLGYGVPEPLAPGEEKESGTYPTPEPDAFLSSDHVAEVLKASVPSGAWDNGQAHLSLVAEGRFLALKGPSELLTRARRALEDILGEARRSTGIRVTVASGGAPILSAFLAAPERGSTVIAAGREVGLVRGYDTMIATRASIVLPQSTTMFGGLALGIRPRRLNGDDRVQLEVRGAWARLKGPVKQRTLGAPKVGTISAPELDVVPISADVTLRTGEPVEVALGSGEGGPLTLTLAAWPID
jgi:hypothetical protein